MCNLTFDEMVLYAKILAYMMGDASIVLSDKDKDIALSLLKKMIDQRIDMTEQQKEQFKFSVDVLNEVEKNISKKL